jgi:hypothetical protein
MTRPWRRGADKFALPALIVGLAISFPGHVSGGATKTAVEGQALYAHFVSVASEFFDRAGGYHFRHMVVTWDEFSLSGKGIDNFQGTATADCTGNVDNVVDGTGPFSGILIVRAGNQQVVWEGHFNARLVGWFATVAVTAHGKGPFEGKLLQLEMVEIPNADPFVDDMDLTGQIIDLGR